MPRLTGRRPRRRDRGAVAVLVSVMVTSGTVFGFGALTVDVGLLYAERTQLQTAADAAAIAVAKVCALRMPECNEDTMLDEGGRYARANVEDEAVEISEVCGRVRSPASDRPAIEECSSTATNLTRCLGAVPAEDEGGGEYVEVRVRTQRAGDTTALPPVFAGALTGTDGVTVGACARASWQSIGPVENALPVVLSDCVTARAIARHGLQPVPSGSAHRASVRAEIALPFREIGADADWYGFCRDPGWPRQPGERLSDATDGFGGEVSDGGSAPCHTSFTTGTVRALAGVAGGDEERFWENCFARLVELQEDRIPVPVAVYRPADDRGAYISSVRGFVITGWHKDDWPGTKPAAPSEPEPEDPEPEDPEPEESGGTGDPEPEGRWNVPPRSGESYCPTEAGSCLFGYLTADPAGGGAAGPSSIRITG